MGSQSYCRNQYLKENLQLESSRKTDGKPIKEFLNVETNVLMGIHLGKLNWNPLEHWKKLNLFKLLIDAFVCELEFWTLKVTNEDLEIWFLVRDRGYKDLY
jgi:hypothetical protein